jgi:hypothetical protein
MMGDAETIIVRILVTKPSILRGVETAQNIFVHTVLYCFKFCDFPNEWILSTSTNISRG